MDILKTLTLILLTVVIMVSNPDNLTVLILYGTSLVCWIMTLAIEIIDK